MREFEEFLRKNSLVSRSNEHCIAIINKPRETFSKRESLPIIDLLRIITADGFGVEIEKQSLEGIRDHVINVDRASILYSLQDILGFASARIYSDLDLFWLHGMAVSKKSQGKGIGFALVKILFENSGMSKMACTTQNPVQPKIL